MNFASTHVYAYDHSDEEVISDEELEEGMYLSDSCGSADELCTVGASGGGEQEGNEESSATADVHSVLCSLPHPSVLRNGPRRRRTHSRWQNDQTRNGHHFRQADTNVLTVQFDKLKEPSHMHTGDAIVCTQCQAVLSHLSHLVEKPDDASKLWTCEFCSHTNTVDLVADEIPTEDDVTYLLEPASIAAEGTATGSGDDNLVVFCIDVSGSMCVTTEVPGRSLLRGAERNRAHPGQDDFDAYQQMMGMRQDVTYISRLQGVQAAVNKQLETMKNMFPQRRVALVTFNNEVTVIGDGSQLPVVIAGDKLGDKDALIKAGKEVVLPTAVGTVCDALSAKVFSLEEGGATALGPALLFSVVMASQQPASKVIICTDGLANVGLGSLDVSVSVVTLEGTECRMVELGQVADKTGGQVSVVDPLKLTQEFSNMLQNPVIATNVIATLILHSGLYFRNEEAVDNRVTRNVGNVTADSELSFEYGVRSTSRTTSPATEAAKQPEVKIRVTDVDQENADRGEPMEVVSAVDKGEPMGVGSALEEGSDATDGPPPVTRLSELPFQLQMQYTGIDGSKSLRVMSKSQPVTKDREVAERDLNLGVIGVHAAKTAANLAIEGNYTDSRMSAMSQQRLVQRWSRKTDNRDGYVNWYANLAPMEFQLRRNQTNERRALDGRSYSDDEDEMDGYACMAPPLPALPTSRALTLPGGLSAHGGAKKLATKKALNRRRDCSDETATLIYRMRSTSSRSFVPSDDEEQQQQPRIPPRPSRARRSKSDDTGPKESTV